MSELKRRLQRLVRVYTCQNTTLLEITCASSYTPYHSCMLSYLLQTMVKQYTTCLLVLLLLTSALGSLDIRRNLRPRRGPRSADMRVGLCRFILSEHTRCYVCARLYNSVELYKDCCNRSQTNILTESCLKL